MRLVNKAGTDTGMPGFSTNIETKTLENDAFRAVLYTAPHSQLVVMTLQVGEEIGQETHEDHDQFIRVEAGQGGAMPEHPDGTINRTRQDAEEYERQRHG
jgi:mannose-6-phosphate isomerase-like protein (cupin superfamily)